MSEKENKDKANEQDTSKDNAQDTGKENASGSKGSDASSKNSADNSAKQSGDKSQGDGSKGSSDASKNNTSSSSTDKGPGDISDKADMSKGKNGSDNASSGDGGSNKSGNTGPGGEGGSGADAPQGLAGMKKAGEQASNGAGAKGEASSGNPLKDAASMGKSLKDGGKDGLKQKGKDMLTDKALDSNPYTGAANSARKGLKALNKAKKGAGKKEDDILDKTEHAIDDGIQKGQDMVEKGVKTQMAVQGGAAGGVTAASGMMVAKAVAMAKAMFSAVMSFLMSLLHMLTSIISAVVGFVGAAVGWIVAAGAWAITTAVAVGTAIIAGGAAVWDYVFPKDDGSSGVASEICVPVQTVVNLPSDGGGLGDGEEESLKRDYMNRLYSVVMAHDNGSIEGTAGIVGNFMHESGGFDPTSVETIYDEPFTIGPRKQNAMSVDFKIMDFAPEYGSNPNYSITWAGIGLGQWTNDRNRLLVDYADEKGSDWYDFDLQMSFMFDEGGDDPYWVGRLHEYLDRANGSPADANASDFMKNWEGISDSSEGARGETALDMVVELKNMQIDNSYAEGILSGINTGRSDGNNVAAMYHQDDGCGNPIKSHYGNQAVDGTGQVPPGLDGHIFSRESLPDSLKEFAKDPEEAGLVWGGTGNGAGGGWYEGAIYDQCVAFSSSYFSLLYPEWKDYGGVVPKGDGRLTVGNWAGHFGESNAISDVPQAGAVFSDTSTSQYGHTGIVQHVFETGDILVAEQNITGYSGRNGGMSHSWSFRIIEKSRYESGTWTFYKPTKYEPQWDGNPNMDKL